MRAAASAGIQGCVVDGVFKEPDAKRLAQIELIARTTRFSVFKTDGNEAVIYEKDALGKIVLRGNQALSFWEELMSLKAVADCRRAVTMDFLCETYVMDPLAELSQTDRSLLELSSLTD